ncbi:hypothetical protein GCM10011348_47530 [Marinobacterium nitratireducens]|uniref:Uncharacterized protein n=1 Tax=Marinobacterium nitratireducens TaxID=518897 RepID=A0A918DXP4_9GAMM|nr:hypothetical protein GCM10011348_47530 [Marinobacterium nitratireducens]
MQRAAPGFDQAIIVSIARATPSAVLSTCQAYGSAGGDPAMEWIMRSMQPNVSAAALNGASRLPRRLATTLDVNASRLRLMPPAGSTGNALVFHTPIQVKRSIAVWREENVIRRMGGSRNGTPLSVCVGLFAA